MGNQTSSSHEGQTLTGSRVPRNFLRSGALGLSKAELDKRCQPSGYVDAKRVSSTERVMCHVVDAMRSERVKRRSYDEYFLSVLFLL